MVETFCFQSGGSCFFRPVSSARELQFKQSMTRVSGVLQCVSGFADTVETVKFFHRGEGVAEDFLGDPPDPLERLPLYHCAAGELRTQTVG